MDHSMRDYSEFCEQLNEVRVRFHKWDNCEKTVALYYLMVGLPFANARFLQHALEQCVCAVSTPEAQVMEHNANDPLFISSLLVERRQVALSTILTHLPLLKPGNKEAADCYLTIIRSVMAELMTPPYKIYNECVEVMSYVFVHPAFNKEDKKCFRQLLKHVLHKDVFVHSPLAESSDESVSPNPEATSLLNDRLNRRSNSLTPAQTNSHESLMPGPDVWSSQESLLQLTSKPRSYSLSNDKTLPVNLNQLQSSSSETRLQDLQTLNNSFVMKSIVSWLKSLRLHKYNWVFNNLSYEQMLNLNEETLISIGITKGARHKLLLSIGKLRERRNTLCEMETEVMNGGDLLNALKKLEAVLQTPLQVTLGEDLASLVIKVFGKVCTQLLMRRQSSEECFHLFISLSEKIENLDVFTDEQKKRVAMWKEQITKLGYGTVYNNNKHHSNNIHRHHHNHHRPPYHSSKSSQSQVVYNSKSSSYPNVQKTPIGAHRHSIGNITVNNFLNYIPLQNILLNCNGELRGSNNVHHVRFKDAEIDNGKKPLLRNVDIESSLESLCLQMMEHALGP